ncbi:MAG: hypothetical protein BWY75_03485 [bacterium ADurb.Bin425]|nr:MAG: hypothetical protein BWY75_03485 [bacterium ADurb.Bin425]
MGGKLHIFWIYQKFAVLAFLKTIFFIGQTSSHILGIEHLGGGRKLTNTAQTFHIGLQLVHAKQIGIVGLLLHEIINLSSHFARVGKNYIDTKFLRESYSFKSVLLGQLAKSLGRYIVGLFDGGGKLCVYLTLKLFDPLVHSHLYFVAFRVGDFDLVLRVSMFFIKSGNFYCCSLGVSQIRFDVIGMGCDFVT